MFESVLTALLSESVLAALLGATVIAAGWFVSSYLTKGRSIDELRLRLRTEFIVDTYRTIESVSFRKGKGWIAHRPLLENAIADLQLFGNQKQIDLAIGIAESIDAGKGAKTGPLLRELRNMWRSELGIRETEEQIVFLRWKEDEESGNS